MPWLSGNKANKLDIIKTCTCSVQGHLVSIHNTGENAFLYNTFGKFWIGGRKEGSKWTWSDGTNWNFQDWITNQPSGDGDCSEIDSNDPSPGTWNDLHCTNHKRPFVCQISTGKPGLNTGI